MMKEEKQAGIFLTVLVVVLLSYCSLFRSF